MTERELYNHVSKGGGDVIADAVKILRNECKFCLIGGLAVNCYVEPVYSMDVDFAVSVCDTGKLLHSFEEAGFHVGERTYSARFSCPESMCQIRPGCLARIRIDNESRMKEFPLRADNREIFGEIIPVACLDDLVQERSWFLECPDLDIVSSKKAGLDLIRISMKYPEYLPKMPEEIRCQVEIQLRKEKDKNSD